MDSIQLLVDAKQKEMIHKFRITMDKNGSKFISEYVVKKTMELIDKCLLNSLNESMSTLDARDLFRIFTKKEQIMILNALNK